MERMGKVEKSKSTRGKLETDGRSFGQSFEQIGKKVEKRFG